MGLGSDDGDNVPRSSMVWILPDPKVLATIDLGASRDHAKLER